MVDSSDEYFEIRTRVDMAAEALHCFSTVLDRIIQEWQKRKLDLEFLDDLAILTGAVQLKNKTLILLVKNHKQTL